MILPRDRYPKMKPRKKLTPGQRKTMAAAFVEKVVEESKAKKADPQERQ